ncbi:hypothetical protein [Streptomyces sp. R35]|uniref:Uncharacterized protein n=1 Tax=Streptomyces sp. R35 TaxID=3238630 RepID=A0AB39SLB4_9ACTN
MDTAAGTPGQACGERLCALRLEPLRDGIEPCGTTLLAIALGEASGELGEYRVDVLVGVLCVHQVRGRVGGGELNFQDVVGAAGAELLDQCSTSARERRWLSTL